MSVTSIPKVVHYDTLESFEPIDGLYLSLIKAKGEEDGFVPGAPCLHLVLNAPDGAYECVFTVEATREDLAKAIGRGMSLALSIARAEWESPIPAPAPALFPKGECVIIPYPKRR